MRTAPAILLVTLSACAVPTTGVVPRGEDRYTVTHQGRGVWVSTDSLKAETLQEADAYCTKQSKRLKSSIARNSGRRVETLAGKRGAVHL